MTSNVQNTGTQICFRDSTDFAPTAANDYRIDSPTLVQIDMSSVAAAAARQSAKVDLGAVRPSLYKVDMFIEHATAPTAGGTVDLYWSPSPSGTAGTANPGGATGADAAFTVESNNLAQMQFIGSLPLANVTTNEGNVGFLLPAQRYGSLIVVNNGSTALPATVDEFHVTLTPTVYGDA